MNEQKEKKNLGFYKEGKKKFKFPTIPSIPQV